jgi:hypothetical protein
MENLALKGTPKTPMIHFDGLSGKFEISGRSIPENSANFYLPLIHWVEQYVSTSVPQTVIHVRLEYFNTSSLKSLVELFRRFEKLIKSGRKVEIFWYYEEEDEDMFESGEDFKLLIKIPIQLIKI